jgi:hypothetical protein
VDTNIVVAIVSASWGVVVATAALVVNVMWMGKAFEMLSSRIDESGARVDRFEDAIGKRLDRIDARLDHIKSTLAGYVIGVAMIKGKLGL